MKIIRKLFGRCSRRTNVAAVSLESYAARMRRAYQFGKFDIEPTWRPGERDVDGFVHDEVVRQCHDPRIEEDGGCRVRWMKSAWEYALTQKDRRPTVEDMLHIAALIEPGRNSKGYRTGWVTVGRHIPPDASELVSKVEQLWENIDEVVPEQGRGMDRGVLTSDDFYVEFEAIHPFWDGNGRTGKILHNWLLGTLDDPVLIVDYFGGGNP